MPYKSPRQRRFMHARHPEIAKRWDEEERKAKGRRGGVKRAAKRTKRKR